MKKLFFFASIASALSGCGTTTFTNPSVINDPLEQKQVCSTLITIANANPLHTFSTAPRIFGLQIFKDSSVKATSAHNLWYSDNSGELKEILVRIDNNDIITFSDLSSEDNVFTTNKNEEFKEQLVEGNNMVIRLNYYDGFTVTLSSDISDFKNDWSKMLVNCI